MQKSSIFVLKIYLLPQPLFSTEWLSILGDKYVNCAPIRWEFVEDIKDSHVIAWDGVITPKYTFHLEEIQNQLKSGKILLLQGEARTLYKNHPFVELVDLNQLTYVELPGWSVLPEQIIAALLQCHQKLAHV